MHLFCGILLQLEAYFLIKSNFDFGTLLGPWTNALNISK